MHSKRVAYPTANAEQCSDGLLRKMSSAIQINDDESSYIQDRLSQARQAWVEWIGDGSDLEYHQSANSFIVVPTIGTAAGGGGIRGALFWAAAMDVLTGQHQSISKRVGVPSKITFPPDLGSLQVNGVGAAFVGGSFQAPNGFAVTVKRQLQAIGGSSKLLLSMDLVNPAGTNSSLGNNQQYYDQILSQAYAKASSGLHPSMTDVWSNMLAYHFLNGTSASNFYSNDSSHGTDGLWSSVPDQSPWKKRQRPFPIMTLHTQVPTNSNEIDSWNDRMVYETTPLETGSYDPRLKAMTLTKYLGTHATDGKPDNSCQVGFDQVSYLMGTSSSPFYNSNDGNQPSTSGWDPDAAKTLNGLAQKLQSGVQTPSRRYDVGNWPNPFKGVNPGNYSDANEQWLSLGGAHNYLPIEQLMVKARNVSVIIALDATGETTENKWPDGTAMQISKNRVNGVLRETHQAFPPIPDDFVKTGVSLHPTFFGCNPMNSTPEYPLIIYIPNAPPVDGSDPVTNPSGFRTSYSQNLYNVFIRQSALSATSGFLPNSTQADPRFTKCFKCAIVDRSRLASPNPVARSDFCNQCFDQYCYDPKNEPTSNVITGRKLIFTDPSSSNEGSSKTHGLQIGIGIAAGVVALIIILVAIIFWRRKRRSSRRRGVPLPINTGQYAPLIHNQDDIWSGRRSYEPTNEPTNEQHYEMGSQPQHTHYRDS